MKIKEIENKTETLEKAIENELTSRNPIPFIAHEADMARAEIHHDKQNHIIWGLIILLILSISCNILQAYLSYEHPITTTTYTVDTGDGTGHAIINDSGEVEINGESRNGP